MEIPKSNIPEEKADDKISFIADSDDFCFSKSKLASAANGIVESSSAR